MSSNANRNIQWRTIQHRTTASTTSHLNASNERRQWFGVLRIFFQKCVSSVRSVWCLEPRGEDSDRVDSVRAAAEGVSSSAEYGATGIVARAGHTDSTGHVGLGNMNDMPRLSMIVETAQSVASVIARRSMVVGVSRAASFSAAHRSRVMGDTPPRSLSTLSSVSFGSRVREFVLDVGLKASFNMSRISPQYFVEQAIGRGSQATVYAAKDDQGETVALKALRKADYEGDASDILFREVRVQSNLLHPNVLKVFGMFDDVDHIYVVMEYAPRGDLMNEIYRSSSGLDETRAATYTRQLASALRCCHSQGAVHRDVKPENVVLGADGAAKLADFGWCLSPDTGARSRVRKCGTPEFRAPEMNGRSLYGKEVDMWALGLVILEMLYRRGPSEVLRGPWWARRVVLPKDGSVSRDAQDLILGLLRRKASKRLTAEEVLVHPWVVRNAEAPS